MKTAYIQVPLPELPTKDGHYLTNIGWQRFQEGKFQYEPSYGQTIYWWLEKKEDVIVMTKEEYEDTIVKAFEYSFEKITLGT